MSTSRTASNDVEPYLSIRWGEQGKTAQDSFLEAKAACMRAWQKRVAGLEALTFEQFCREIKWPTEVNAESEGEQS